MKIDIDMDSNMEEREKNIKTAVFGLLLLMVTLSLKIGGPRQLWVINNPQGTYGGYFLSLVSLSVVLLLYGSTKHLSNGDMDFSWPEIPSREPAPAVIEVPTEYRSELSEMVVQDFENGNCPQCGEPISGEDVDWEAEDPEWECDNCES